MGSAESRLNHSKTKSRIESSLPESWGPAPRGRVWIARQNSLSSSRAGHLSVLLDLGGHSEYEDAEFTNLKMFRGVEIFLGLEELKPRRFTRHARLITAAWPRMEKGVVVEEFNMGPHVEFILVQGLLNPLCSWDSLAKAGKEWSDRLLPYVQESFREYVDKQRVSTASGGDVESARTGDVENAAHSKRSSEAETDAQVATNIEEACTKAAETLHAQVVKGSKEKNRVKSQISSLEKTAKWCPPTDATASSSSRTSSEIHDLAGDDASGSEDEENAQGLGANGAQMAAHGRQNVQQDDGEGNAQRQADGAQHNRRRRPFAFSNSNRAHAADLNSLLWDAKINSHTFARALVEGILSLKWPMKAENGETKGRDTDCLYKPEEYADSFVNAVIAMNLRAH